MIFIDTDILLDIALKRVPFWIDAASLLDVVARDELEAGTTTLVVANCYYMIGRLEDRSTAETFADSTLKLLEEIPLTFEHQRKGLKSNFKDKEDAFNYFALLEFGGKAIVTRNKNDFRFGQIPVFTAKEYLNSISKS